MRESLTFSDLVSDAVALTRPVAAARGVRLAGRADADADADAIASVDSSHLSRALSDLLGNVVRHTRPTAPSQ